MAGPVVPRRGGAAAPHTLPVASLSLLRGFQFRVNERDCLSGATVSELAGPAAVSLLRQEEYDRKTMTNRRPARNPPST
ncbi:hypothetical protein MRX96_059242 [Rhipicephalus microplus]